MRTHRTVRRALGTLAFAMATVVVAATALPVHGGGGASAVADVRLGSATASWTRDVVWTIDKSPDASLHNFLGDSQEVEYVISPSATATDTVTIAGTFTITHQGGEDAEIRSARVQASSGSPNATASVDCNGPASGSGFPFTLGSSPDQESSRTCAYTLTLPSPQDGDYYASVVCDTCASDPLESNVVAVTFPASPVSSSDSVILTDTYPEFATAHGDPVVLTASQAGVTDFGPFDYVKTFRCTSRGSSTSTSTATLRRPDNGPDVVSASAATTLECDALRVSKTAHASFTRTHKWHIDKYASHDQISLVREKNPRSKQSHPALSRFARVARVHYAVKAYATQVEGDYRVGGYIDVDNPNGRREAHIASVSGMIGNTGSGKSYPASVSNCRVLGGGSAGDSEAGQGGYVVPAGGTLRCNYVGMPLEKTDFNLTEVRAKTFHYPVEAPPRRLSTRLYSTSVPVDWIYPTRVVDAKARVYDSRLGLLGWARAPEPDWFEYTLLVTPGTYGVPLCGYGGLDNQASVVGHTLGTVTLVDVRVPARVRCFVHTAPTAAAKDSEASDPKPDSKGAGPSDGGPGYTDGVKSDAFPVRDVVCRPSDEYKGKRGAKTDPAWTLIGPAGRKTPFYELGTKMTYGKVVRRPGKGRSMKLAKVFAIAKLYVLSGSAVDARTSRAMLWSDRHFTDGSTGSTPTRRSTARAAALRQRKQIAKNTRVLKRFNRASTRQHGADCGAPGT